jgi:hypothetical protein
MVKRTFGLLFVVMAMPHLNGQVAFPDLVARAFGSDQELVNGILFSNQYWGIEGHPYFLDGKFRAGSVVINHRRYEQVMLRYNLYEQKVEIKYTTVTGNRYQFMSVAQRMPAFSLDGLEFRYMQFKGDTPAYYQVITVGKVTCYVGWKKEMEYASSSTASTYRFSHPGVRYRLMLDGQVVFFHNRKTFKKSFPVMRQKEVSKLLKQYKFNFKEPSAHVVEMMMKAVLPLYETDQTP